MPFITEKQPGEKRPFAIDFVRRFPAGETLDGNNSTVVLTDADTGANAQNNVVIVSAGNNTILTAIIRGGNNGDRFHGQYKGVTTPSALEYEDDIIINIVER